MSSTSLRPSRVRIKPAAKAAVATSATPGKPRLRRQMAKPSAAPRGRANPEAQADPLVAAFAAALAGSTASSATPKRRSLKAALQRAQGVSALDVMPGVRLPDLPRPAVATGTQAHLELAPCLRVHRQRRRLSLLHSAAAWCLAVFVSAGIVSAVTAVLLASGSDGLGPRLVRTASTAHAR